MENKNQLPKNWQKLQLGKVCSLKNGFAFKSHEYQNEGIQIIRISDIKDGKIIPKNTVRIKSKSEFDNYIIYEDDILVAMSGATTGKFGIYKSKEIAYQNQRVGKFSILNKNVLDNNFLLYQLDSLKRKIEEDAYGGAQPNISSKKIEEMYIVLPPIEIQKLLVSKIEQLFSDIDKGIDDLKLAQQLLKVYRQSVLKWAFEGKLTNENVKDGELPEGWTLRLISEISMMNPKLPNKDVVKADLEVQFLPMKLVEEIVNKVHLNETRKFGDVQKGSYTPFIDGDLLFAKVTPCMENGKIAVVKDLKNGIGYGSSEFHVLRSNGRVEIDYLFYFLVQDRFRNEAANAMTGAVGLRRVPKQFIENHNIPLPTITEQKHIVQEIESRLSVADKMEESIADSLKKAEALKMSVLGKAFRGELV